MPLKIDDSAAFAEMLSSVAAIYGKDVTPQVTAIYWQALLPYDLAAVRQSFDRHVKNPDTGQFMPKPADLIRMLGGTTVDAAHAAWAKVEHTIRRVGAYADVAFDDPVIHRVIEDMGGWQKLCSVKEDELPFRAKDFQTMYRGWAMRREIPAYPRRLIGITTSTNARNGHQTNLDSPPALIGDRETALLVWQQGGESSAPQVSKAADVALLQG